MLNDKLQIFLLVVAKCDVLSISISASAEVEGAKCKIILDELSEVLHAE